MCMKISLPLTQLIIFLFGFPLLLACVPNRSPRNVNEPKLEWQAVKSPVNFSVEEEEFYNFDLKAAYAHLTLSDLNQMFDKVIDPLSRFVLNSKYIEDPKYRKTRLFEMVKIFNYAYYKINSDKTESNPTKTKRVADLKKAYYNTVFSGCSQDLRTDCVNIDVFSRDGRSSLNIMSLAQDLDEKILKELDQAKIPKVKNCIEESPNCRLSVIERYRRLAMASQVRASRISDGGFAFTYLKFSRLYSYLLSWLENQIQTGKAEDLPSNFKGLNSSYLSQLHGQLFETLISSFSPDDLDSRELQEFVSNFNPWNFSERQVDAFQHGNQVMFDLAVECCIYSQTGTDGQTGDRLNENVREAILSSQSEGDQEDRFGPSFFAMVKAIKQAGGNEVFAQLNMKKESEQFENLNTSEFYNEVFFVVDRLYREHLSFSQAQRFLSRVRKEKALISLPHIIRDYVRVSLLYMLIETNRDMKKAYNDQSILTEQMFDRYVEKSTDLARRWLITQERISWLDKLLTSYFAKIDDESRKKYGFDKTSKILKSVNRNIHYIAVYPHMILVNYYLSKRNAKVLSKRYSSTTEISPADIIEKIFAGVRFNGDLPDVWFQFGTNEWYANSEEILYAFQFLVNTQSLDMVIGQGEPEKRDFFSSLLDQYLEVDSEALRREKDSYLNSLVANADIKQINNICEYELSSSTASNKTKSFPRLRIDFLDLIRYTYTGAGEHNGLRSVLAQFLKRVVGPIDIVRDRLDKKLTYLEVLTALVGNKVSRPHGISDKNILVKELEKRRQVVEKYRNDLIQFYLPLQKKYFKCLLVMGDIEQKRMNRLYEEERNNLRSVYAQMKTLDGLSGDALQGKVAEINKKFFESNSDKFQWDKLDGKNYLLHQYDVLKRIGKNVESDIFSESSESQIKRREVELVETPALQTHDMIEKRWRKSIPFNSDEEEFVKQGMSLMNGNRAAFVEWAGQIANESELSNYFSALVKIYLSGPFGINNVSLEVTADEVIEAYLRIISSYTMSDVDIKNMRDFSYIGKKNKEFFYDWLIDRSTMSRLPLFHRLMSEVYDLAGIGNKNNGPIAEATSFYRSLNSIGTMVFDPGDLLRESGRKIYGPRALNAFKKVEGLFERIDELDTKGPLKLMNSYPLLRRPFLLESNGTDLVVIDSESKLKDEVIFNNFKNALKEFSTQTDKFYQNDSAPKN